MNVILSTLKNKYIVQIIVGHVNKINLIRSGVSYRFNNIPSLKWVVENDTGDLLHLLCKPSLKDGSLPLSKLQVGWATLDMIVAVCSPHRYHKSITFKLESFDTIFKFYSRAFKYEHLAVDAASESGNIELVKYLLDQGTPFTTNAIDFASKNGYLEVIKLLLQTNPINHPNLFDDNVKFTNHSYDLAATNGHLRVLFFFDNLFQLYDQKKSKYRVEFTVRSIDGAAKNKHWDVVNHILERYSKHKKYRSYLYSQDSLKWCIAHNNLNLLIQLFDYPYLDKKKLFEKDKWLKDGLREASEKGHIDMIRWVYNQKLINYIPDSSMMVAAQKDQLEILRLYFEMYNNEKPGSAMRISFPIFKATHSAIQQSQKIETFQYLFQIYQSIATTTTVDHQNLSTLPILEAAFRHGCLEILKWIVPLIGQIPQEWQSSCIRVAGLNGRLDVLNFLVDNIPGLKFKQSNLEDLCGSSCSLECVKSILSMGVEPTVRAINNACMRGFDNILECLLSSPAAMSPRLVHTLRGPENTRNYYEYIINSRSPGMLQCILAIGKEGYEVTASDLYVAVWQGDLKLVKYFIQEYPHLLDSSQDQHSMDQAIQSLVRNRNYQMVDYVLGLKCYTREDLEWRPTEMDRFNVEENIYQIPLEYADLQMLDIILQRRPTLPCPNAKILLSQGYFDYYDKIEKRNKQLGLDDSLVNHSTGFANKCWFFYAIILGNIDLIHYLVHYLKKIQLPPPQPQVYLVPRKCSARAAMYLSSEDLKLYPKEFHLSAKNNFILQFVATGNYTMCKCIETELTHSVQVSLDTAGQQSNITLLRLIFEKKKKSIPSYFYTAAEYNINVINFFKKCKLIK
ncbi:hypothetical protein DFA_03458 [Cavenderia fasciculata]|uniref:Ankyrin repeat-containing protein n=1 Tax=Cavenderia fasciculata TaxID=261658 RepID=F4PHM6_CACFS|nr:uncharacterized protein DFA_03458 [Cavenderia fasciculata]EGG25210.1 hypothetical protein DFA_03458 [Cavenderia fasciculata]|eukprot:XP_004363061.1 hypothetical protein DFA_03458 [Cavenderia fasciculata]